jgi:hypothetical protein
MDMLNKYFRTRLVHFHSVGEQIFEFENRDVRMKADTILLFWKASTRDIAQIRKLLKT